LFKLQSCGKRGEKLIYFDEIREITGRSKIQLHPSNLKNELQEKYGWYPHLLVSSLAVFGSAGVAKPV